MTTYGSEPDISTSGATGTGTPSVSSTGTTSTGTGTGTAAATAADQGKHVAGTAKDEALNVAGTAKEQASNVVGDAKQQVTSQLSDQATTQRDKLSQTLRTFGDDLQQMAQGQGAGEGMAADVAREVSDRVRAFGSQLENRDPSQLLDDARDFARRRPGAFLLGALAAGVVAGRMFRATADGAAAASLAEDRDASTTTYPGTTTGVGVGPMDTPATYTGTTGPPRADFAAAPPTLADPAPSTDPTTSGLPGQRTQDVP